MLKKWILFCCVLITSPCVFAYGHMGNLFLWKDNRNVPNQTYLSYQFIYKDELSFCTEPSPKDWKRPISAEILSRYFQAAFREWTRGTARYLRESGRGQEFADVIALLEKPFELVDLGVCKKGMSPRPDIEITAAPPFLTTKAGGYYAQYGMRFGGKSVIAIVYPEYKTSQDLLPEKKELVDAYIQSLVDGTPSPKKITLDKITRDKSVEVEIGGWKVIDNYKRKYHDQLFSVMLHEVGHSFGLIDEEAKLRVGQTSPGPLSAYGGYASKREIFRTPYVGYGLMSYNGYYSTRTADDVMGLITILDRFTKTERIIYPLLHDFKKPEVGAIVNGHYKYPPVKKSKKALRLFKQYFTRNDYLWGTLYVHGEQVFEREFSPVPGYPAKYRNLSPAQKAELLQVKKQLEAHLQKEQK